MITLTMSIDEVKAQIMRDYVEVMDYSYTKEAAFAKRVKKASVYPVRAYTEYVSKSRNKWLILYEALNRKHTGQKALMRLVCCVNAENGYYAYVPAILNYEVVSLLLLVPHLFRRYSERAGVDKTGLDLIRHYIENNNAFKPEVVTRNGKMYLQAASDFGVALGEQFEEGVFLLKTFVSWEETFDDQYALHDPLKAVVANLEDLAEEFLR